MMKNNRGTSFIIVAGIFIITIFTGVVIYNLLPRNKESNSYYVKEDNNSSAKIVSLSITNGKLNIETNNDTNEYCIKTTKTNPDNDNLCWKKINNKASISIYKDKKYYIWLKDNKGIINSSVSIQY